MRDTPKGNHDFFVSVSNVDYLKADMGFQKKKHERPKLENRFF
jgi:hypothetical protein